MSPGVLPNQSGTPVPEVPLWVNAASDWECSPRLITFPLDTRAGEDVKSQKESVVNPKFQIGAPEPLNTAIPPRKSLPTKIVLSDPIAGVEKTQLSK